MNPNDAIAPPERTTAKRLLHAAGVIVALVVTALFVWYVTRSLRGHDLSVYANRRSLIGIAVAILIYCFAIPLNAFAWQRMLSGLGIHKGARELTAILGVSQIAKYIPGNVGQYVGRGAMSLKRGIPIRPFTITTLLEVVLTVAAALCVGICTGMASSVGRNLILSNRSALIGIACVVVLAIASGVTFYRIGPALVSRFAPKYSYLLTGPLLPPKVAISIAFVLYCGCALVVGASLVILTHILFPHAAHSNWLSFASVSLAWIIGFVTPGAPAGLGVREGLLLLMLGPVYGTAIAGVIIIALRVTTTAGDLLCCVAGLALLPRKA